LSLGVTHAAHPQDLSSMPVLYPQKVIHDSILIGGLFASEHKFLRILSLGPANSQHTLCRSDQLGERLDYRHIAESEALFDQARVSGEPFQKRSKNLMFQSKWVLLF
jgi:hypothetical protein